MALFQCSFFAEYLGYETKANVILPETRSIYQPGENGTDRYKVLYLLHGRGDDYSSWARNTCIEQFAQEHAIAVIMPSAEDSFYSDSVGGKKYFSYMTQELPQKMSTWFPVSIRPEETYIAGLSMGGYGALKIGLTYPERFAGIGAFSSVIWPDQIPSFFETPMENRMLEQNLSRIFGGRKLEDQDDPIVLLKQRLQEQRTVPPIVQYEGTQDILYKMNQEFCQLAKQLGQDITYEEWEGVHDWRFWNRAIEKFLNHFLCEVPVTGNRAE